MAIINRSAAEALIQEQIVSEIFQKPVQESTFLRLARRMPDMTSNQTRIRVLDTLPMAYWVSGDTGFKQTAEQAWDNVYINAEELAVIVPIPEAVLDDASIDIMAQVTPRVREQFARMVDLATIFGINKPASWRADIITTARQAGNNVAGGTLTYDKLLGEGGLFEKVEAGGNAINGVVAALTARAKLRGIKTTDGLPIFKADSMQGATNYALDGAPVYFPVNGGFDPTVALMIAGDWNQAVYAIRQDVTVKILDQAIIQDPSSKAIVYNLAQQDMIALRVVFRMGWALPNPVSAIDTNRTMCPFAYIEPATAATTQKVTFTVTDGATQPAAIAGAKVEVDGVRKITGSDGKAEFNLRAGTYAYKVSKQGATTVNGFVTVAAAAVSEAVTLK